MKILITLMLVGLWACGGGDGKSDPSKIIEEIIPRELEIEKYPAALEYLTEEVEACGGGVVLGAKDASGAALENRCEHTIQVDAEFLRNHQFRTGLIHDPKWAQQEGVTFYEPKEMALPDAFDIRDSMKNGLPELRKQAWNDCWAWATHHGVELTRAIHDGKVFDHAVQSVISCSGSGTAASGGYMSAVGWPVGRGLPLESDYPYSGKDSKCKYSKDELAKGWEGKIQNAPYIGSSLSHSLYFKGSYEGTKVQTMMNAIHQWKSPLVVTVAAYSQSSNSAPTTSISQTNHPGNHMVAITGWGMHNGKRIANVWNSWGSSHGNGGVTPGGVKTPGVSSIVWEGGPGKLNRGLGVSARILQYKAPCTPPEALIGKVPGFITLGSSVKLGKPQGEGVKCKWLPETGLSDPNSCETIATPEMSTEYHLEASNDCGKSSAMALVTVLGPMREKLSNRILTPHGVIEGDAN